MDDLSDDDLQALLEYSTLNSQQDMLQSRIDALRQPGPKHTTGIGGGLGAIAQIGNAYQAQKLTGNMEPGDPTSLRDVLRAKVKARKGLFGFGGDQSGDKLKQAGFGPDRDLSAEDVPGLLGET